ncbi:class I SAM-dependent methyltransferase [Maricaulis sp. CAU 1757]
MDSYSATTARRSGGPRPTVLERLAARYIRAALAHVETLRIDITLPRGHRFVCGPSDAPRMVDWQILKWNGLLRIASSGVLGFAEGFLNEEWETSDLRTLLGALATELDTVKPPSRAWAPSRIVAQLQHWLNANTKRGSRRNIAFHYDLGNDFYRQWLDPSMTYSSAVFAGEQESLADAQARKYRQLCERLELKPGDRVLEIGCGWGGFAEIAIREFGCHVTGLTLSREQLAFARERLGKAGLADHADLRLQDYRDVDEQFDAIASIEMFEAVGQAHWPVYFDQLKTCLKPGGRAGLQIITIREDVFEEYRRRVDFIQKYVFPGGMLPTVEGLGKLAENAGLASRGHDMFGHSYARTLERWHHAYRAAWPRIRELGFDDRFDRIWRYYLAYCEAGFDAGRIDVGQFMYENPTENPQPR